MRANNNSFRGLPTLGPETSFQDIFRNFDTRTHIKMSASGDWGSHPRKLEIYLQKRQQVDTIRSDALERASIERLTRPLTEGEFELVFRYQHGSDDAYTSRAWWVAEQMPVGPVTALTNEGIRQERQAVHNRDQFGIHASGSPRQSPSHCIEVWQISVGEKGCRNSEVLVSFGTALDGIDPYRDQQYTRHPRVPRRHEQAHPRSSCSVKV